MWPGRVRTRGANMILTTRTIGLLVTMAVVTGGAAWGVHALIASAGGAGSDYGLDTNGNGKFEWLVVEAQVSLPTAGTWEIYADLSTDKAPGTGACGIGVPRPLPMMQTSTVYGPIAWTNERYFFPVGSQTVRMSFNGTEIARAGVDGPYAVHVRLSLGGMPYMGMPVPEPIPADGFVEWNYTTRAYAVSEFEPPVRTTVFLRFRGDQLRQTGLDGPWDFALTLFGPVDLPVVAIGPPTGGLLRPVPISYPETLCGSTRAYRATDFDDTVEFLRYTGRFEESTPDRDGNGKYDALVVRAEVDVLLGAGFAVSGVLRSVGGSVELARATGQLWLRDGLQWVEFVFPGPQIRGSGVDGPYEGMLSITPGPAGIDPTTTYIMKAYRAADFDNESLGTRGYWISNVTATPTGSNLAIAVGVTRARSSRTWASDLAAGWASISSSMPAWPPGRSPTRRFDRRKWSSRSGLGSASSRASSRNGPSASSRSRPIDASRSISAAPFPTSR